LRVDPNLAEAHFARASLLSSVSGRLAPQAAIQEDRRALELNPNLAQAHHQLGSIYLHLGLLDKAVDEFRRTLAIDPGNYGATRRIGLALVYQGRYEDGLRLIRQVPPESNQSLWNYQVAWALLYLGRNAEASAVIERYLREHPEDRGGVVTSTRAILDAKTGTPGGPSRTFGPPSRRERLRPFSPHRLQHRHGVCLAPPASPCRVLAATGGGDRLALLPLFRERPESRFASGAIRSSSFS